MKKASKNISLKKHDQEKQIGENQMDTHLTEWLTGILAICAMVSCYLSYQNINVIREIEHERARPMVVLNVLRNYPLYGVCLQNTGLTAAHDVVIRTEPEIKWCFGVSNRSPVRFLKEKIDFLPPNASYNVYLGEFDGVKMANPALLYRGTIQYTDITGRRYEEPVTLDYSLYEEILSQNQKRIHDIGTEPENMSRGIDKK